MKLNGVLDMKLVEKLIQNRILSKEEFVELLSNTSTEDREILRKEAVRLREKYYGHDVYIRGLIEFTNYCKNNCYYCGIFYKCKFFQCNTSLIS